MRLYLSSFRMGNCPGELLRLCGAGRRAGVIANATDSQDVESRVAGVARETGVLAELGFQCTEIDLRRYFEAPAGMLRAELQKYDVVWLRGGNVFVLRYALARSRADKGLVRLLSDDALVYAGYSAGPCVLAPSLRGLDAVDPPERVMDAYGGEPIFEGLNVLNYAIVPHVDSPDHPATRELSEVAAKYRADGVPHRAMRDGEVLIIDGDQTRLCG
jgi:dipeptidase E